MEVRYLPNNESYQRLTTEELRKAFVLDRLFNPGTISMVYCDVDRAIIGGAVPTNTPLKLLATKKEMAAEFFTERREVGVANIGGEGTIRADGQEYTLAFKDMLYIGRGVKNIEFSSARAAQPAAFYLVSFPAHTSYPVAIGRSADAERTHLGSTEAANKRTINKYIHAGGVKSCQLVMGLTELEVGSVWNSMPPHTHMRRMEVYLYFDLDPDSIVVHLMGKPEETRSVILRDRQAVISPSWSIHCGAATRKYSFIWAMAGENQEFTDMDALSMRDLR
ncbi:MAG: 5-dehydro-4-deoxy-D-glucuronate isomerase [Bacteroidota bacterium]